MIIKFKKFILAIISYIMALFTKIDKNKIVCINFGGKGYGCNPKYIAQEAVKENFEVIWLVNDITSPVPKELKKVKYVSLRSIYELETAKVIVTNTTTSPYFIKRKKQYLIQTWHSSHCVKVAEKGDIENLSKNYIKQSKKNSELADLFISNSKALTNEYKDSFWCKCKILESGLPRNDILCNITMKKKLEIKKSLKIDNNKKIILYVPTFRDNGNNSCYNLNFEIILKNLKEKNYIVLIRMHPNVLEYRKLFNFNDKNIIDVTNYGDIQELLFISDILITDYSSCMMDFALLKKPIFLYINDLEDYLKTRKLKPLFYNLPFDKCKTQEELINKINNLEKSEYLNYCQDIIKSYLEFDDGKASKRIVNEIKKMKEDIF